jgi:hypothetical protein
VFQAGNDAKFSEVDHHVSSPPFRREVCRMGQAILVARSYEFREMQRTGTL